MKPDIDELAKEVYCTAMRHDGHKDWSYCEEWRKQPWRDAVRNVLDRLNQPETPMLTREEHLKHMARAASDDPGWWWQRIGTGLQAQWIPVGQYVPEPGESLLIRRKTEAVEEAQFDGTNFHEHDRPDRVIPMHQISEWTYLYEPETKQE